MTGSSLRFSYIRANHGFTLLEVLIAISIIAIALTSLFGSQSYSLMLAAEAKFNTVSAFLSREIISGYESGVMDFVGDEGDFGDDFPGYQWKTELQEAQFDGIELESLDDNPLYRIDLTVSWGEDEYVSKMTYYGRPRGKE